MNIRVVKDYDEMSKLAAEIISEQVKENPSSVLGLATGSSPIGTYKELIKKYSAGELSFKDVKTVNLDEYVGLGRESSQSYVNFMRENLFSQIDVDEGNTHIPDGKALNAKAECENYNNLLKELPRDVQLLGLGSDGHIGFNEPGTPFEEHTHIATLTESTVKDNSRLFASEDEVPRLAITMGIADIMQSKKIILLACGANKAKAVRDMVKGEVTVDCPASILQRHANVEVILDNEAAGLL